LENDMSDKTKNTQGPFFATHDGQTVEVLRVAALWDLMERYPESADRCAWRGLDYISRANDSFVAILYDGSEGIPMLVPTSEVSGNTYPTT
jgi:hypothetical protein